MSHHCIIFDCDGTLVDSEQLGNEVLAEMVTAAGLRLTGLEAMERFRGVKLADCLHEIEQQLGHALPASFVPDFRERTARAFTEQLKPITGAVELVGSLTMPFCVASSGPREKIELSLLLTGLLPFFTDRIFSSYEVGSWKPDPGLFLHAAQALRVEPSSCIVVEDSLPGIIAGLSAGMSVVAFQPHRVDSRIPTTVPVIQCLSQLPYLGVGLYFLGGSYWWLSGSFQIINVGKLAHRSFSG